MSYWLASKALATSAVSARGNAMLARLSLLGFIAGVLFGLASGLDIDMKRGLMQLAFLVTQLACYMWNLCRVSGFVVAVYVRVRRARGGDQVVWAPKTASS